MMEAFRDGEDYEEIFKTSLGGLGFLAEVVVEGSELHLKDLAIYPTGSGTRMAIGLTELRAVIRRIEEKASSQGFKTCLITAERLSGISPGRIIRIRRRLT